MIRLPSFLLAACLGFGAAGHVPAAEPVSAADTAASAREDLERSTRDLAALRKAIQAEKVPLAAELTRLEAKLAESRRRSEELSRGQDMAALEATNLAAALKLRQDEMTYIQNLLDEYAHGFEATLHVAERPQFAAALEAALSAPADPDLALADKLATQVDLVRATLTRAVDLLGGERFPGEAVSPEGNVTSGQFALVGPVVLFDGGEPGTAGLALPQVGSERASIRPLEENLTAGIQGIVTAGAGALPLDPSRGGALQELLHRGSLIGYFEKGGAIMYPLLLVSILAVTVILERVFFLLREQRRRDHEAVSAVLARVEAADVDGAIQIGRQSRDFVARALTYAIEHREKSLGNALMRAANLELVRFTRGISILDTVITAAPLLGLLGTVTGMMGSFGMLGGAELSAPAQITGGIAEALIATAFGLGIAITSLLPMNFFHSRAEEARHALEDASTHLELLMKPVMDAEIKGVQDRVAQKLARELATA